MIKVTVLSVSDGRQRVNDALVPYIDEQAQRIKTSIERTGDVEVTIADEIVWNNELAKSQGKWTRSQDPDAVIFNRLCRIGH